MLKPMVEGVSDAQAVRRQLERVLASPGFARNERLSRFLRFIIEQFLEGRQADLKESVIAIEVFGRANYDPQQDSIVRTEASRLRARLSEYYSGEGKDDPLVIELPKGGYVPIARPSEGNTPVAAPPASPRLRPRWSAIVLGCVAIGLAAAAWWQAAPSTGTRPSRLRFCHCGT